MLEFAVPPGFVTRAAWEGYVRVALPALGLAFGRAWWDVGRFLRGSVCDLYRDYPLSALLGVWHGAGIENVHARLLTFGGGVVVWGIRG